MSASFAAADDCAGNFAESPAAVAEVSACEPEAATDAWPSTVGIWFALKVVEAPSTCSNGGPWQPVVRAHADSVARAISPARDRCCHRRVRRMETLLDRTRANR